MTLLKNFKYLYLNRTTDPLLYLSITLFIFWVLDAYIKIFIRHSPLQILWWSSFGLGLSVIALFFKNIFLITSLASALFFHELLWIISFLSLLLFDKDFTYFASYMFNPNYPVFDYYVGLYHVLLLPFLLLAIIYMRKIHTHGWVGATVYGLCVLLLSYFFPEHNQNINCVNPNVNQPACRFYFGILYDFEPLHFILKILLMNLIFIIAFFWPANLFLTWLGKNYDWKIVRFRSRN